MMPAAKICPAHHRLWDHHIANLETLRLAGVPDGFMN